VNPYDPNDPSFKKKVEQATEIIGNLVETKQDLNFIAPVLLQLTDITDVDELVAVLYELGIDACLPQEVPKTLQITSTTKQLLMQYQQWQLEIGNPLKTHNAIILDLLMHRCPMAQHCDRFSLAKKRFEMEDDR